MKHRGLPDRTVLQKNYEQYAEARAHITRDLKEYIEEAVRRLPSHPTVKSRAKEFASFLKKYISFLKNHAAGSPVITDLVGIRIVCPFIEDIDIVEGVLQKIFEVLEVERKGSNYSFKEFGYESTHLLVKIPDNMIKKWGGCDCEVAEIQIRTILQDAWAEVEHELVYKAEFTPFDEPMKRKLAAVNANLSLADIIFQEIRTYQRQLNGELGKRRDSFFRKIEESTDAILFNEEEQGEEHPLVHSDPSISSNASIDVLLLNALYAHNKNQFTEAIAFYSRILEMNPEDSIRSLIFKHRGMANFAQSQYRDAIEDFSRSLELDPTSYKAS
jgi:putative GTP pyrophosphokinase